MLQLPGQVGKVASGAAGVGVGSLVAIIASALPEGLPKNVLIWFAPVSAVVLNNVWEWVRTTYVNYKAIRDLNALRTALEKALDYPALPEAERAGYQAARVRVERMIVRLQLSKIPVHIVNADPL